MAMMHILQNIRVKYWRTLNLSVVNFNHLKRVEAYEEGQFIKEWCEKYSIPVVLEELPEEVAKVSTGFQEAARDYRRDRLQKLLQEHFVSQNTIENRHHMGDNMETLMMKFLRGVHVANFSPMESISGPFVRPLLHLHKEDLEKYLQTRSLTWREDVSNQSRDYKRNRVRLDLLPLMEELSGGRDALQRRLLTFAEQSQQMRALLIHSKENVKKTAEFRRFPSYEALTFTEAFIQAPSIVVFDLISEWILQVTTLRVNFVKLEQIYQVMQNNNKESIVELNGQWRLIHLGRELRLSQRDSSPSPIVTTVLKLMVGNRPRKVRLSYPKHLSVSYDNSKIMPLDPEPALRTLSLPLILPPRIANGNFTIDVQLNYFDGNGVLLLNGHPVGLKEELRRHKIQAHDRSRVIVLSLVDKKDKEVAEGKLEETKKGSGDDAASEKSAKEKPKHLKKLVLAAALDSSMVFSSSFDTNANNLTVTEHLS
eukprot:scaffold5146_cov164-Ochromonas_danica.AAC.5